MDQWVSFADSEIAANTTFIYQLVKGAFGTYVKPVRLSTITAPPDTESFLLRSTTLSLSAKSGLSKPSRRTSPRVLSL